MFLYCPYDFERSGFRVEDIDANQKTIAKCGFERVGVALVETIAGQKTKDLPQEVFRVT